MKGKASVVVVVAALLACTSSETKVYAEESAYVENSGGLAKLSAEKGELTPAQEESFQALESHLYANEKRFDLTNAKSDLRIEPEMAVEFAAGLLIQGWEVDGAESGDPALIEATERLEPHLEQVRSACAGKNGFQALPPAVLLNSCAASAVQNAYASGAGIAGIAAVITAETGVGAVVAGTIAGILAASSGLVGLCNSWGRGVKVFATGGCWSQ